MNNYQHEMNVLIAQTLEKLQEVNPELYGTWYSKLYQPHGDLSNWNVATLHQIEQALIDVHN